MDRELPENVHNVSVLFVGGHADNQLWAIPQFDFELRFAVTRPPRTATPDEPSQFVQIFTAVYGWTEEGTGTPTDPYLFKYLGMEEPSDRTN